MCFLIYVGALQRAEGIDGVICSYQDALCSEYISGFYAPALYELILYVAYDQEVSDEKGRKKGALGGFETLYFWSYNEAQMKWSYDLGTVRYGLSRDWFALSKTQKRCFMGIFSSSVADGESSRLSIR